MVISNRVKRNISLTLAIIGCFIIAARIIDPIMSRSLTGRNYFEIFGAIIITCCALSNYKLYRKRVKAGILFERRRLLIFALVGVQACLGFAQNLCLNDSVCKEIRFPLTERDTETVFFYFNNEWFDMPELALTDSIQKMAVKNDEYGNRALFCTISPEYLKHLKSERRKHFIDNDPRAEFPGGNGKLKEWLDANIRVPEGYKGSERVIVQFYVQPDGTITDPKIIRPSKNDAANSEALRLVNALPKFRVKYYRPKKHRLCFSLPITFTEPGTVFIRGKETE